MAVANLQNPMLTQDYALLLQSIRELFDSQIKMHDATGVTNIPTGAIRLNMTTTVFEKYNGTTWAAAVLASSQVGLGNCNNTSDANKPISLATQTALNTLTTAVNARALLGGVATQAFATANLTVTGTATISGDMTSNSDERIKTNWRPVAKDFVARLAKVMSGIFDRTDMDLTQAGASAQSMQDLCPEVVRADPETGLLRLAYANAALVSCIELAKEVVELRAEVELLKARA